MILYPGFFQDGICHVAGFYFTINSHFSGTGLVYPNVMVSLAMVMKEIAVSFQNLPNFFFVFRHCLDMHLCKPLRLEIDFDVGIL